MEETNALTSFFGSVMGMLVSTAHAEAPPSGPPPSDAHTAEGLNKPVDEAESEEEPAAEEEAEEEGGEGGDEEDEEEPEDQAPAIRAACEQSKECSPAAHHFQACSKKVEGGKGWAGEDCVEELFHLMHCVDACAAPKLFKRLV